MKITYHKDGSITFWDVFNQRWVRTTRPSNQQLESLGHERLAKILKHISYAKSVGRQ